MCSPKLRQRTLQLVTIVPSTLEGIQTVSTVPTKKPSISFSDNVHIRFSLCLEDYSSSEYDACWYSAEEYEAIEKDMCRQFMKMEKGKKLSDIKSCSRGLERYLTVNAIPKKENQGNARKAVFEEQARQTKLDQCNEEAIARAYNNISASCQMWAAVLGLRDQREAAKYIEEEDEDDDCYELETLTQSQDYVAPQKNYDANSMRSITPLQQVAVTARSA